MRNKATNREKEHDDWIAPIVEKMKVAAEVKARKLPQPLTFLSVIYLVWDNVFMIFMFAALILMLAMILITGKAPVGELGECDAQEMNCN